MKHILSALILSVMLVGCSTKGVNATLFLQEEDSKLVDLAGATCLESGYQVMKHPALEDKFILITTYENCKVTKERVLRDFEPKQWPKTKAKMRVGF